jgi:hypothetical protein
VWGLEEGEERGGEKSEEWRERERNGEEERARESAIHPRPINKPPLAVCRLRTAPPSARHSWLDSNALTALDVGLFDQNTALKDLCVGVEEGEERGRQRAGREGGAGGEREEHRGRQRAIQEEESAPLSL